MDHEGGGGQKGRWVTKTCNSYLGKNVALCSTCVLGKERNVLSLPPAAPSSPPLPYIAQHPEFKPVLDYALRRFGNETSFIALLWQECVLLGPNNGLTNTFWGIPFLKLGTTCIRPGPCPGGAHSQWI